MLIVQYIRLILCYKMWIGLSGHVLCDTCFDVINI
jgi:hypothetical protein